MEVDEAKAAAAAPLPLPVPPKQQEVATLAVDALSKELKYENLAMREEMEREFISDLEDRKQLEQVKAADECL